MPALKPPLMIEKRRALHEKRRERRHPEVGYPIARIRPATLVGKRIQASSQRIEEGRQNPHPFLESDSLQVVNRCLPSQKAARLPLNPEPILRGQVLR